MMHKLCYGRIDRDQRKTEYAESLSDEVEKFRSADALST